MSAAKWTVALAFICVATGILVLFGLSLSGYCGRTSEFTSSKSLVGQTIWAKYYDRLDLSETAIDGPLISLIPNIYKTGEKFLEDNPTCCWLERPILTEHPFIYDDVFASRLFFTLYGFVLIDKGATLERGEWRNLEPQYDDDLNTVGSLMLIPITPCGRILDMY